ncbi:Ethyl tert-butyl ether degradation EthD [Pseudonocardia dioxanivorans CB1190]|uniref:Ethyl tert-butyl ether degradation EthD n=1 Tax=Pseudonocardia dioxanivorans (strain ATCC 55486 / DSM 44775 / JCM 13855 / CB1190) TaxID=675635 RepID=F4CQL3_PSEUX|nr:EthD family reductase [Pseudonocardia dioxanivorans]AEA22805.1 Ethyl tert-butyl ether degradation EthD [Pseudonocardia dioxanivorans CB1190]
MYKLIATWSAPSAEQLDEFETHYEEVHAPAAAAVPHLRRIVLTRTADGLEGATPGFHRVAEMFFDSPEALEESSTSPQWAAMRADAGGMIERFGVTLTVALGWESELPVGG